MKFSDWIKERTTNEAFTGSYRGWQKSKARDARARDEAIKKKAAGPTSHAVYKKIKDGDNAGAWHFHKWFKGADRTEADAHVKELEAAGHEAKVEPEYN